MHEIILESTPLIAVSISPTNSSLNCGHSSNLLETTTETNSIPKDCFKIVIIERFNMLCTWESNVLFGEPRGWRFETVLFSIAAFLMFLGHVFAAEREALPIVLEKSGGFQIGGRIIRDPNAADQTLSCDHGYMEYFIPWTQRNTSLVMWHSAHTQIWQNRWDGGTGFKDMFLRKDYPVYLWDGPWVGRANWACSSRTYIPSYRDQSNFVAWNFGPSFKNWWPGVQFPTGNEEAWQQATSGRYEEFDTPYNVGIETDAAVVAVDSGKLGNNVVYLTNSAGGLRAMITAGKSVSKNIKGIVTYESIGHVFPNSSGLEAGTGGFGPFILPNEEFQRLANVPAIQFVWGDNRSPDFVELQRSHLTAKYINEYGGNAEVLMLGEVGLKGSTHSAFADMDNEKVADLLDEFLHKNGLDGYIQ